MGTFVEDTFTTGADWTQLSSRTGELGASWSGYSGEAGEWYVVGGVALPGGSAGILKASGVAGSDDHTVTCPVVVKSTTAGLTGIFVRGHDTQADCYYVYMGSGADAGKLILARLNDGDPVESLGSWSGVTTGSHTLVLSCSGTTISASWDGTVRISVTDSDITTGRRVGVRSPTISTPTTGKHLVSFTATDDVTSTFARVGRRMPY